MSAREASIERRGRGSSCPGTPLSGNNGEDLATVHRLTRRTEIGIQSADWCRRWVPGARAPEKRTEALVAAESSVESHEACRYSRRDHLSNTHQIEKTESQDKLRNKKPQRERGITPTNMRLTTYWGQHPQAFPTTSKIGVVKMVPDSRGSRPLED
ncbi:hypothetical protein NDU88_001978 [Pleurodeles waltl]|uniref:Uncharacterized protein n=1 Tax=Pleurodeles waltl TaxID=8319 RepID=A0AAV7UAZ6_PLEWA|nr:hypothetical protein NDU88_001978 [Pleurodeles waltl]